MKVKIKGLVFVGAAAAILLSAGAANAAKTARNPAASTAGVVTSQKYTESTYEYVADKVDGTVTGNSLGTAANSEDQYPSMKAMKNYTNSGTIGDLATFGTNGLETTDLVKNAETIVAEGQTGYNKSWKNPAWPGSDTSVPSEQAVITALNAVNASISHNKVNESTYIDVTEEPNNGGTTVSIASDMIQSANTDQDNVNTSGHGAFLATASAVQRKQDDPSKYQVSKDAEWADLSDAVAVGTKYMTESTDSTSNVTTFAIDETKLVKTSANVNVTGNNGEGDRLVTSSAVQKKMDKSDNKPYAGVNNDWEEIEGVTANYTEVVRTGDATNGYKIQVKVPTSKVTTSGDQLTASDDGVGTGANGDESDLVTALAVKEYVRSMFGGVATSFETACGQNPESGSVNCALVMTRNAGNGAPTLEWKAMAGGTVAQ